MGLDVYLYAATSCPNCNHPLSSGQCVFSANITHNLGRMAAAAGCYEACWRPDEHGITTAAQVAEKLRPAIAIMKSDPDRFQKLDAENGWGRYIHFVPWLERYLAACEENPTARVEVSR